jgi:hypothetical protein
MKIMIDIEKGLPAETLLEIREQINVPNVMNVNLMLNDEIIENDQKNNVSWSDVADIFL